MTKKLKLNVSVNRIGVDIPDTEYELTNSSRVKGLQFLINAIEHNTGGPLIKVIRSSEKEVVEYANRIKCKAVDGFTVSLNDIPVYSFYILSDGSVKTEDLLDQLIKIDGNARASERFMKSSIIKLQGFAHTIKSQVTTYHHFYGELTEDQKKWQSENVVPFEHEVNVAREKAKIQQEGEIKNDN